VVRARRRTALCDHGRLRWKAMLAKRSPSVALEAFPRQSLTATGSYVPPATAVSRSTAGGQEAWQTRAVAIAAMPSPRPVRPRPSVVVADRLTGAPDSAALRTAIASARRGPILGLLPMT